MNIYDIAARAGVSIATVSRVLNGSDKVAAQTRSRVQAAMDEANYSPNVFARSLGLGSMRRVGVLCEDVANAYAACVVSVLERLLRAEGYDVLLYCTGSEAEEKQRAIALLMEKQVDAVAAIGAAFCENLTEQDFALAAARVPVVLLGASISLKNVYCVLCDEAAGIAEATAALHAAGRRNLLYVYDTDSAGGAAKRNGFVSEALRLDIAAQCTLLQAPCEVTQAAFLIMQELGNRPAIDAIVTSDDVLAVAALHALRAVERATPVIGFGNSLLAECTQPTLTSVDNMPQELAAKAAAALTALFAGGSVQRRTVVQPHRVERESFRFLAGARTL